MHVRALQRQNFWLIAAVILLSVFATLNIASTFAEGSANDVIAGGIKDEDDLQAKCRSGDGRNSSANIQAILRQVTGIACSDMDKLVAGTVTRSGEVIVSGKVVATGAESSGRLNFRDSKPLGNTGAFTHRTDVRFSQGAESLAALVKLDEHGRFQYAILKHCGNPIKATPKQQSPKAEPAAQFRCKDLKVSTSRAKPQERLNFTVSSSSDNTRIEKYIFDFGDGTVVESSDNNEPHTYNESGNYLATVQIDTTAGTTPVPKRGNACALSVSVQKKTEPQSPADLDCIDLKASVSEGTAPLRVDFTAQARAEQVKIERFIFDFGDDSDEVSAEPTGTNAENASATHIYNQPGTYVARVRIQAEGEANPEPFETACRVTIRVTKPAVVQMAAQVTPPVVESQPPPTLPDTGTISVAAGVFGTGSFGMAVRCWLVSRRKLVESLLRN